MSTPLVRPDRGLRSGASTSSRAESSASACGFVERCSFYNMSAYNWCDNQLCNPHAAGNNNRFAAEIDQQHLDLAPVVRIDRAGRVEDGKTISGSEARTRPNLRFITFGERDRQSCRNENAGARRDSEGASGRHRCKQVEPRRMLALVGRQWQVLAMSETHQTNINTAHYEPPTSACEIRATSRDATSSLLCGGQVSIPEAWTSVIMLRSPPITPDCGETSFARIQSQPFLASFALAFAAIFSVSAANPITRLGR